MTAKKWLFSFVTLLFIFTSNMAYSATPTKSKTKLSVPVQFVQLLAQGKSTQAVQWFDTTMASKLPPTELSQVWQSLCANNGKFKNFQEGHTAQSGTYAITFIPAVFERDTVDLKVVTNSQDKIAGFWIVKHIGSN